MRLPVIVEPLIVPIATTIVIISSYQAQIVDILSAAVACGLEDKTVPIIIVLLVLISVCVQKFPFSHERCISLHSLLLRLLCLVKT